MRPRPQPTSDHEHLLDGVPHTRASSRGNTYIATRGKLVIEVGGLRFLDWSSERVEPALPADVLFVKPLQERAYYEALLNVVQPRVVIPIHWDDFTRPLSQPLRPMFKPPRLTFPPLKRVDLSEFHLLIKQTTPQAHVFLPEIFRQYDLRELLACQCKTSVISTSTMF